MEEERLVSIKELVDAGLHSVPPLYVRPPHERPTFLSAHAREVAAAQYRIPVIDITQLHARCNHDSADDTHTADNHDSANDVDDARTKVIREIGRACEEWGFFQVVNHGIEPAVIQQMREAALKFHGQSVEEKMRFHSKPFQKPVAYFTKEVRNWKDTMIFNRFPDTFDGFKEAPDICKKEVLEYIEEMEALAERLYSAIFESVGLDKDCIGREVPGIPLAIMSLNYYPPCPDPSLTLGLSGHSDACCLTILLPSDVPGLEIKYKGSWVPVFSADPNAFVINVGDLTEILTNSKYKSIEHRVVTNAEKPRMTIANFFSPREDAIVAPLPKLLNENNPPLYKPTKCKDYFQNFSSNHLLPDRGTLDFARI